MKEEQLTVAQALKFTRHDFLNDLQIILMNLDLGNIEQAKKTILATTDKMKHHSLLSSLNLPKTELWLASFEWIHTSFNKMLNCYVKAPISSVDDEDLVISLENSIKKTNKVLDPFSEYHVHFDVISKEKEWSITMEVNGNLPKQENYLKEKNTFTVEGKLLDNIWTFTIRGR